MNKNESKYFNTAIKMDEALITLLEKKDFEYITIKDICDTAGVNRSTFYLHYENTSDLLKETTRYIIDKHLAYYEIDKKSISLQFETCKSEELLFITDEYLVPYLTFIKDNQRLFKVSIKQFNSFNMNEVYGRMFEQTLIVFDKLQIGHKILVCDKQKFLSLAGFKLQGNTCLVYFVVCEMFVNDITCSFL